jgi:EmrB/QacA subfamily drug resistance transporter
MVKKTNISRFYWTVLAVVCVSVLIVNIDNTILNVALPTLVRQLHATSDQLQWIVDSYAMVFAGLLLVGGSLADRFGRKRFSLAGITIFALGSIGAAFSGSVNLLIAWRAVMGLGSALTIPTSLSIINDVFRDPKQRAKAIGIWGGMAGVGIALGPIAGGLLLAKFWWGSIFIVNLPIALIAFIAALFIVPDSKNPNAEKPDYSGSLLSIAGLGLLLWAIIEAPIHGWSSNYVIFVGLASLVVLATFIIWEAHSAHPMLKLKFFADHRFSIAALAEVLGVFGLMGGLFMQTQFLQFDLGYSPIQAGVRILPLAAVLCVVAPLAPIIARHLRIKFTVAMGMIAIAGGLWQIAIAANISMTYLSVLPGMLLIGIGAGLLLPIATNSVVGSVPREHSGVGSATNAVAFQVGGALGVAVIGSILSTRYQNHMIIALAGQQLPNLVRHNILGSLGGALGVAYSIGGQACVMLAHTARLAFVSGFKIALEVGAAVALGGGLVVLGWLPSGHPKNHNKND